jgi:HK97 family phage major capsid protein
MATDTASIVKSISDKMDAIATKQEAIEKKLAEPVVNTVPATPIDKAEAGKHGFNTPRDFCLAVMKSMMRPTEDMDPRLIQLYEPNIERRHKSLSVTKAVGSDEARGISDPYGGFLVPTTFVPDVLKIDPETDPIGGRTRNIPMATPTVKIPARSDKNHTTSVSGGLTVTRRPETVAGTPSQMSFEQVVLEAHNLFGISYATEELLTDSPVSFAALLSAGFSDQFTYHLIKERLYGTGVGEFMGILTALDASGLGPTVSVAKESSQVAATIVYDNVTKMRAQCWGYDKAIWLANHDCYPQLSKLSLPIGIAGTAMYTPSLREDRPDMLLGRPIIYTEYCKTIGTQGDLILANWNEYLEGTYQPMQNAESIHVRFVNHERTFKFWTRNAGQPWWKVAITPAYSSSKLSPFIVLDTRS